MAGHYYYDPRPFYSHNGNNGLMPMDELFYGRYEPVPYWMDQRMVPVSAFNDYHPGQQHGINMIRNGNGNGNDLCRQMEAPREFMPNGSNGNGQYRQMEMPMNGDMSHKSNNMGSIGNHSTKQTSVSSNQFGNGNNGYNGFENVKSSQAQGEHGGKSMSNSNQGGNTKQRYAQDDYSSDDSDNENENRNNNGLKWATNNTIKHGSGHQSVSQTGADSTYHKGGNHGSYDSNSRGISSQHMNSKKSGGHGENSGGSNHGSTQSKISKLLRFQGGGDSSSSDSEDERYGHSNKGSKSSEGSKGQHLQGSTKMSNQHDSHGFQNYGQQQGKQMDYSSQSKGVELKVPICCDNCERKVRACLEYMDGVENVLCDQWNRKVIVYGNVKADNVLKRVRRVKKTSELWQQAKQQQHLRSN